MLLDIDKNEFEKMSRAGFFENVRLRAQTLDTARERCKALGLVCVSDREYRTGNLYHVSAVDIQYHLIYVKRGFWLVKQK